MQALLAQPGQVAADAAKGDNPLLATKGAGGFLHFGHIPTGVLYQKVQHLLTEDATPEGSHPPIIMCSCLSSTVVAEVLSPTTEARDRGQKSLQYRSCPSIQEYLLISSEFPMSRFSGARSRDSGRCTPSDKTILLN